MNHVFQEHLASLIDSSISISASIGQRQFNRRIELESIGRTRMTRQLLNDCLHQCERLGIDCEYRPDLRDFSLTIDLHTVVMSYPQAKAFSPSLPTLQ